MLLAKNLLPIYPKADFKYLYECTDDKRKDKIEEILSLVMQHL